MKLPQMTESQVKTKRTLQNTNVVPLNNNSQNVLMGRETPIVYLYFASSFYLFIITNEL